MTDLSGKFAAEKNPNMVAHFSKEDFILYQEVFLSDNWDEYLVEEGLAFLGLDIEKINSLFIKRGLEDKRDMRQIKRDQGMIISFYVLRGLNYLRDDIKSRTLSVEAFDRFLELVKVYGIQKAVGGKIDENGEIIITPARLAAANPHTTFILHEKSDRVVGELGGLPKHLAFPQVIPLLTDEEWEAIKETWYNWNFDFQLNINKKGRVVNKDQKEQIKDKPTYIKEQEVYVNAARTAGTTKKYFIPWRRVIHCDTDASHHVNKATMAELAKIKLTDNVGGTTVDNTKKALKRKSIIDVRK